MITRHSSRRSPLDAGVLRARLAGASSYDRIAGYFRSSLFEIAGEELDAISGPIRIICNSDLDTRDVLTAQAAQQAIRSSWCRGEPESLPSAAQPRIEALYRFLSTKHMQVKVLPDEVFGLIHGKAGLIRYPDGRAMTFLGSVNESATAWKLNYELLWEDDSPEAVAWVVEEFESLWHDTHAVDLACCPFVEADLKRLAKRKIIAVDDWRGAPEPSSVAVESPVYRREQGLWPHQKYFIRLAIERHRRASARLVLADQVGLGKTVQLAMAALLMALESPGPILILAPKALLKQWQVEMVDLLKMPSARWTGNSWVDENGIEYPFNGIAGLTSCPRRVGLVSQGLITRGRKDVWDSLLSREYLCIIVDEAHRARRRNIPKVDASDDEVNEKANPNKLMEFLQKISPRTRSMLLATATPVQLHPVEAWDLLGILGLGHSSVLGDCRLRFGPWWHPAECLEVATGSKQLPEHPGDAWNYLRDPVITESEDEYNVIRDIRDRFKMKVDDWTLRPEDYERIPIALRRNKIEGSWLASYSAKHNPLLRGIVRRTRQYLEETINPVTKQSFLPKVAVVLYGESTAAALSLGPYLSDAYAEAENFSRLLAKRVKSAGFFKTLLLRRLGSSIEAGKGTISRLLARAEITDTDDTEDDEELFDSDTQVTSFEDFTGEEVESLHRCLALLESSGEEDPKLAEVYRYLFKGSSEHQSTTGPWLDRGCILFSQYYDTAFWIGQKLARHPLSSSQTIGLYAGSGRSLIWENGSHRRADRDEIKAMVAQGRIKILLGTDAASEGLNLQRLGSLIHIDLPWNPTRLEQRKGRIQRIGQRYPEVWIANLRYRDSVEDRVHELLSQRLAAIHGLFGQIPDTLEDVWIAMAMGDQEDASRRIDRATALKANPFDAKYSVVVDEDWDSNPRVIDPIETAELLKRGW
ncbi:MAG: hypothetical protein A2Y38_10910 [Spirochaetes bacterium GWB1_59_5]|nr:MAG: hypothetical protein A2Y38_10910 [Spirochaetes bacterium GWB1_59_5]